MYENIQEMIEEVERITMAKQIKDLVLNMFEQAQEMLDDKESTIKCLNSTIEGMRKEKKALTDELNETKNKLDESIQQSNDRWDKNTELEKELEYYKSLTENEKLNKEDAEQRIRKLKQIIQSIVNQI
ncbi:MAG: DUF842 domain-containing protein [Clostridium lundense]|nr:DUF842 domain-containing protein [Clostridium lundense]